MLLREIIDSTVIDIGIHNFASLQSVKAVLCLVTTVLQKYSWSLAVNVCIVQPGLNCFVNRGRYLLYGSMNYLFIEFQLLRFIWRNIIKIK